MTTEQNKSILDTFKLNANDTGSLEVQVIQLTESIIRLSGHLAKNNKDFSSKRGLVGMVSQRKKFLRIIKENDQNKYEQLVKALELRK